ncbi:MAG: hypothetical protein HY093_00230 [Candidatus Liptonbacteria bacterium]|nr:hypothetical protein [Candidatus Liptonbacteria bacterium]
MSKKLLFILVTVMVLLLAIVIWLFLKVSDTGSTVASPASPYSAVYLSTGEIYFGKLSWFPRPKLSNVWFLQRSSGGANQPGLNLLPFKSVIWGPESELYLNSKDIVFWTKIRADSQIIPLMNQGSVNPNPSPAPTQPK